MIDTCFLLRLEAIILPIVSAIAETGPEISDVWTFWKLMGQRSVHSHLGACAFLIFVPHVQYIIQHCNISLLYCRFDEWYTGNSDRFTLLL